MFSPVSMRRVSVVVLERDERVVLQSLGELGAIQLVRTEAGPDTAPLAPRDHTQELARCDRLSAGVEELRQLLAVAPTVADMASATPLTLLQADESLRAMRESAGDLVQRRQRLQQQGNVVAGLCEQVSSYRGLDLPLDGPDASSFLHFATGHLPAGNLERLQQQAGDHVALLPLATQEDRQPLIVMTTRHNWPALEATLRQAGFQPEPLPVVEGETVDTFAEKRGRQREALAAEWQEVNSDLNALADELAAPLARIERLAGHERQLLEAEQHFPRTEAAVLLTGWIPEDAVPRVQERLREATSGRHAVEVTAPDDVPEEQIPVLLRHSRLLQPFELLVSAYGLPKYRELAPTLFVAVSYVLMFGMMFGDAGHGAVLAAGGLIALLAGRGATARDLGVLLLCGGLSSVIFGVVYGSYFGLPQFKHYALWHDPLEGNPMTLMHAAMGFGIVMISLGIVLNVINRLRHGDWLGGMLDKFGAVGALFYWGALVLVAKYAAIQARGLTPLVIAVVLVLPVIGWSLKEPLEYLVSRRAGHAPPAGAGLIPALTESLVGAFEAVLSYFANTVSFVRLAAYAMSHAALLLAAFMMAAELKNVSPGGSLLSVLVIILGNVIAIVLEGIVASVQALRLEYYEFFGKFFSGGGQPFRPFRLVGADQNSG